MKKIFYLLLVALISIQSIVECKRSISTGGSRSSSSSLSTRRTSNTNSRQSGHATSRPATTRPASNKSPNVDNTKLSYGNNAAPPAYSPVNNPSSISRNQAPPPYSANNPAGHSTLQSSNYPRQNYAQNGPPPSYGQATYHQPGNMPPGATMYSGPQGVPHGQPTFYQQGHVPAGATMYGGPGGGYHPAQSAPTFYQPNQLPPGAVLYSQPPKSSGPGLGTGLVAGAIGGAILGHVLTPTHSREVVHSQSAAQAPAAGGDSDRIIIINNGPPGSVTTTGNGATVIDSNAGGAAAAAPAAAAPQETPVPLAPFPAQPGSTQEAHNMNAAGPVAAPIAAGATMAEVGAANAAMTANDTNAQPPVQGPPPGSIACYPIMVNQTDPADETKVIQVEQIACYEVPANPQVPADQQQQQPAAAPAQSDMSHSSPAAAVENMTQKTSSATVAESAQIKQNGAFNVTPVSFWSSVTFALFVSCSKILMS